MQALEKHKPIVLSVIGVVLVGCLIWIVYALGIVGQPRAKMPTGPEWTLARDATQKLREDVRFTDVEIFPDPDAKGKFRIVGSVSDDKEMRDLEAKVAEVAKDMELTWEIHRQ